MTVPAPLRASLWSALLLACAPACSVVNTDHCGNQDGHATCLQRDPAAPYCSICVADNNGCLAVAPPAACLADTAPATTAPTTDAAASTSADPTTSTSTSSGDTTSPTSTSTSTTTSETTTTGPNTSSTTTTEPSTGDTTANTTGGPVCGNNKVEGDEVCDGTDFNGETCKTVVPGKWGGGSLGCNECLSLNDSKCCVGLAGACGKLVPDAALPCCGGLTCKLDGLPGFKCMSQ